MARARLACGQAVHRLAACALSHSLACLRACMVHVSGVLRARRVDQTLLRPALARHGAHCRHRRHRCCHAMCPTRSHVREAAVVRTCAGQCALNDVASAAALSERSLHGRQAHTVSTTKRSARQVRSLGCQRSPQEHSASRAPKRRQVRGVGGRGAEGPSQDRRAVRCASSGHRLRLFATPPI